MYKVAAPSLVLPRLALNMLIMYGQIVGGLLIGALLGLLLGPPPAAS